MTQPAPPPEPPPSNTGQIVAATAIGLALIALESRIQQQIEDDVEQALQTIAAVLILAIAVGVLTGTELLSRKDVHATTVTAFDTARTSTRASIAAGYTAGAQLALRKATRDMTAVGHEVPSTLPPLGGALDQILADITTAYGHAQTDLANTVIDAFDGVQGDDADTARQLTVSKAVEQAGNRLAQRLGAAGATAVHQGASDAQNAIYDNFTKTNPYLKVRKIWRVTATDPCAMCRELNGTEVDVDREFDHQAGSDTTDWRPVWRNLLGPPRHPHCRCQLELVTA